MPFLRDAHADPAVLAFLAATTIVTGVAFGLAPLLELSNSRIWARLFKDESRVPGGVRTRLRHALVIAEIAFSLVLLVGAGLMVKSLGRCWAAIRDSITAAADVLGVSSAC